MIRKILIQKDDKSSEQSYSPYKILTLLGTCRNILLYIKYIIENSYQII